MRLRSILVTVAAIVGVLAVVVVAAVAFLDLDRFRPRIEAMIRDATGRDVTIQGPIRVAWALRPTIAVENVTIANAPWGSRPEMLKAERLAAKLALLPLLHREVEIDRVEIDRADLLLETDRQGRGNWVLDRPTPSPRDAVPSEPAGVPLVRAVRLTGSIVVLRDAQAGIGHTLVVDRLDLAAESADAPIEIRTRGTFDGAPVELRGTAGSLAAFLGSRRPIELDLKARLAELTASVRGRVEDVRGLQGLALDIAAEAGDPTTLAVLVPGLAGVPGPIAVGGHVTGDARRLVLDRLTLKALESEVTGRLELVTGGARPAVSGTLQAGRIATAPLAALAGKGSGPEKERSDRVFPAEPVPTDRLRLVDLALELAVAELVMPTLTVTDMQGKITLRDGALRLEPAAFTAVGSRVTGRLAVAPAERGLAVEATLKAPGVDAGALLTALGVTDLVEAQGNLALVARGQGGSVAALMDSLDGQLTATLGEGRLRAERLHQLVGGVRQVVDALGVGDPKGWVVLRCFAADAPIESGVAEARVLVLETDVATVTGQGTVDLGQERYDLVLTPRSNVATLNLAVPVELKGSFKSPKFGVDEGTVAAKLGAGLLGALVFPPAALGAFADLGSADNPCLKERRELAPAAGPSNAKRPRDTLEQLGKGLGDLLRR